MSLLTTILVLLQREMSGEVIIYCYSMADAGFGLLATCRSAHYGCIAGPNLRRKVTTSNSEVGIIVEEHPTAFFPPIALGETVKGGNEVGG